MIEENGFSKGRFQTITTAFVTPKKTKKNNPFDDDSFIE